MVLSGSLPQINLGVQATRGLLATDHVILNRGRVTWTTPELAPPSPNYHTNLAGIFFEIHSSKIYGSTGSMMSILAGKVNSFLADIDFSADDAFSGE
ncbi:hypothetical protein TNCV_4771661 [Trichonephila clavipes]|nr:hypothetical protein TNCV_4771661 [Trichonephila clavipes]